MSQSAVAQTIDVSRSVICRIEQGDPNVSSRIRARVAAALGAEFRIAVYPSNAPLIHDAAHARMVEAVLRRCHPTWRATVEAPVPGPGRRSTDIRFGSQNRCGLDGGRDPDRRRSRRSFARWPRNDGPSPR